jgi:organic hydroperoxide reductase OsmC/OhrA
MITYPQRFHAEATAHSGIKETWQVSASDYKTECSIPEIYSGTGEAFSPEELFLLSLQNCFVASFKVYAEHTRLNFDRIDVLADLDVDLDEDRGPVMKSVEMKIDLYGVSNEDKAKDLIDRALKNGFIFNSIQTSVRPMICFH